MHVHKKSGRVTNVRREKKKENEYTNTNNNKKKRNIFFKQSVKISG